MPDLVNDRLTLAVADHALDDFPLAAVLAAKGSTTVSVCIPARNEAATVGLIVDAIVSSPVYDTIDEFIVMDDRSTDDTARVASESGARVVAVSEVLPGEQSGTGKGNVLWKSVAASTGDIVVWIDADLTSFQPEWILGLIGPLLIDPELVMVKAHFERPELAGSGGGRTTEIMVRPLLSTFFPHLTTVRQPLAGEYAVRRTVLEQVPFSMGYGVETGLLIDIVALVGIERLAQVDLGVRTHRNRPASELSAQAMEILLVVIDRAGVAWQPTWGRELLRPAGEVVEIQHTQRPSLRSVGGYPRTT